MISALVINLEKSVDRLAFQKKQLAKLGISMQRLPAIECEDISEKDYELQANGWERKMRPAEVACFLSHQAAWQYVSDSNKPWLILEDDALLAKSVSLILAELVNKQIELNIDYVTLETRHRRKWIDKKKFDLNSEYQLRRLYLDRSGAAAYVLFPSGARKLLLKSKSTSPALADAFLCSSYELSAWQVYPAAAMQLDQCENYHVKQINCFSSTISPKNSSKPHANCFGDYLMFKWRRIVAQCRMGLRQLRVFKRAEQTMIPIISSEFEE